MKNNKLQILRKEKEARDVVNKINSVFYEMRESYNTLVSLFKESNYSKKDKQQVMQDYDKQVTVFKNLLNRLNDMFELSAYEYADWRTIWNG